MAKKIQETVIAPPADVADEVIAADETVEELVEAVDEFDETRFVEVLNQLRSFIGNLTPGERAVALSLAQELQEIYES